MGRAWVFYLASYLSSSLGAVFGALFIVYLLSINFVPAQIGLLLGAQRIAILVSEVPTGIFADKFGRKKSILLSFFFSAALSIFWLFTKNFSTLLVISALSGIAFTFQSGAKESLMIQSLNCGQNDTKRNSLFKRMSIWSNIGLFSGGLIALGLALIQTRFIWVAAACLNLLLFLVFLVFVSEKSQVAENYTQGIPRISFVNFLQSIKETLPFLVITFIFGIATSIYGISFPIFFKKFLNFPDYYFGILGSLSALVGMAGIMIMTKIFDKKGFRYVANILVFPMALLFMAFGVLRPIGLILIVFFLIEGLINGWFPVFQSFFNKFISDKIRTTVLSASSVVSLIAIALGEIAGGFLLKVFKPNSLIAFSSIFLLLLLSPLWKIRQRQTKNPLAT